MKIGRCDEFPLSKSLTEPRLSDLLKNLSLGSESVRLMPVRDCTVWHIIRSYGQHLELYRYLVQAYM